MKTTIRTTLALRKRQILRRLDKTDLRGCDKPMLTARKIHYEIAKRQRGIAHGGIGTVLQLVRRVGLAERIDRRLHLLKIHMPYHESDHVLNFAINALCDGTCLQDIELRRNDIAFLDALGARRIPDPTTAGDFCRRFSEADIRILLDVINETRLQAWAEQPDDFFEQAIVDVDGSLVGTTGQCKQGMDIAYDGTWGYHSLIVSLANTQEVLSLVNRSGNRPSHEGAAAEIDGAVDLCLRAGFHKVLVRGDTDFSQTQHLDRWNAEPRLRFLFGFDARDNLQEIAEKLPPRAWQPLERPPRYQLKTQPRQRPDNEKDRIVRERNFEALRLNAEEVAEFNYRPTACRETYRMIVTRKNITRSKGEQALFDEVRYFFHITNDWVSEADELVFLANERCHQENLIEQLKNGVRALRAPVDTLLSNWAYMVMTALAWNLKAWWALLLPAERGRWCERHRQQKQWLLGSDFRSFCNALIRLPCQIIRTGRRLLYRLLSWNPQQSIFFRWLDGMRSYPMRC